MLRQIKNILNFCNYEDVLTPVAVGPKKGYRLLRHSTLCNDIPIFVVKTIGSIINVGVTK